MNVSAVFLATQKEGKTKGLIWRKMLFSFVTLVYRSKRVQVSQFIEYGK